MHVYIYIYVCMCIYIYTYTVYIYIWKMWDQHVGPCSTFLPRGSTGPWHQAPPTSHAAGGPSAWSRGRHPGILQGVARFAAASCQCSFPILRPPKYPIFWAGDPSFCDKGSMWVLKRSRYVRGCMRSVSDRCRFQIIRGSCPTAAPRLLLGVLFDLLKEQDSMEEFL